MAGPRVRESGRGGLCILLAKAAQEGVGKPGLRSVPCRQILTTRHHFTPFSKTQGQLENAAGLLGSPRQGWWREVAPWSVYIRVLPVVVHCSARPHSCSCCYVVIVFSSFGDFWFLSPAAGPRKITKPRAPELRRAQAPTTAPAMLILRLSCGGFSMGLMVSGGGLGSSPRKNGVQVCSTNFGGLVKLSDAESQRQHVRNPILADGAMHCTATSRCCSPITSC